MAERTGAATVIDVESSSYEVAELPVDLNAPPRLTQGDEIVEDPTFEELFSTLREARLARQILVNRKNLQTWEARDPEEKRKIEKVLEDSGEIRGFIKLPERLLPLRVGRASELIEAGKRAQKTMVQRLRDYIQPQLEVEFGEHARDLKWEVENAIKQVIVGGRINNEEQIRADLKELFGVTSESRIREVKSLMTGEEIQKYDKNVQAHIGRLKDRLLQYGVDLDDAKQEAQLAVLEAISNYKPELGKFPSYLFTIINGRLWDLIRNTSPMTRGQVRNFRVITEFEESFEIENGRAPTVEEIEQATGIDRQKILDLKEFPQVFTIADLGEEVIERMEYEGYEGLRDLNDTAEPEDFLVMKEDFLADNEKLTAAFEFIPDREKLIIYRHDVEEIPHHEIGKELRISESRCVQLYKRAVKKLRRMLLAGVSLKEFLGELGISDAMFSSNRFGEGLMYQRAGRSGAQLGPVEMLTIKKRVEAHKQQVIKDREARKEQTIKRHEAERKRKRRQKGIRRRVKNRQREKNSHPEKVNGHRPKEYKPVKPDDLDVLLELYSDQLKVKEVKVLRLRSGLEDGVLRTLQEAAISIGIKTAAGASYIERRGLEKLRKLEPSVFVENSHFITFPW